MEPLLDVNELVGWGVYDVARLQDPYPVWNQIRTDTPVLDAGDNVFLITSWDLVDQVLRDHSLLAGRGVKESIDDETTPTIDATSLWLMSLDGQEHVRARSLVRRRFTARRVKDLKPFVDGRAKGLVGSFLNKSAEAPADFVRHVALALPSEVIRSLFHVEPDLWAREVHARFLPEALPTTSTLIGDLTEFFQKVETDEGLFHDLQAPDNEGNQLSPAEVIANAVLLTMAAVDTTAGLIANSLFCLLQHPALLARLRELPELIDEAVEETLRLEPSALSCSRFAPHGFELGGVKIPAGSHLLLCMGAANRDPAKYENPDAFQLGRDYSGMLTFGGGRHFCLGASLARMEARAVIEALLEVAPRLSLTEEVTWRTNNPTIRIPQALKLSLSAAPSGKS